MDIYSKLEKFYKIENGRLVPYGYRIDYDQNGKERGRTEPAPLVTMWTDKNTQEDNDETCVSDNDTAGK